MKIVIFTSTRADSGIMAPIARELTNREEFEVHALVTGTHLSDSFGRTVEQELSEWGPVVIHEVPMNQIEFSELGTAVALGNLQAELAGVIHALQPDLALVLGDRSEAVTFAFTCSILGVPIAHFHGGEISLGALDELHRHAITKLSSLHFPADESAVKRITQMGEQPDSIFFFGPLIADRMYADMSLTRETLAKKFSFSWAEKTAIVTMHGAKFDNPSTSEHLDALFNALDKIKNLNVIFTGPNSDPESQDLRTAILQYCSKQSSKAFFVESFGSDGYLRMLEICDVAIGNSSSLVHEAPFKGIPIVTLGSRQEGRGRPISAGIGPDPIAIERGIRAALEATGERAVVVFDGLAISTKIAEVIAATLPVTSKKIFWSDHEQPT